MKQTLVSVRYCVKGWQISTATGATVSFSLGAVWEIRLSLLLGKRRKEHLQVKKIRSYTSIWNVEKVLYAINDVNLPFPVTFTQITWFVLTEFIIILFADVPPLSMIEGAFLKYFGIPVALTWFMSQKTFDGKKPYSYIKTMFLYALRPKVTYAGKAVNLHKQKFEETITAVRSVTYVPD